MVRLEIMRSISRNQFFVQSVGINRSINKKRSMVVDRHHEDVVQQQPPFGALSSDCEAPRSIFWLASPRDTFCSAAEAPDAEAPLPSISSIRLRLIVVDNP
mmetsp:Transcript_22345/g.48581  ORF Transcript_22345/g.48581 Transcript_22345/m.48581 type:complete len:101 (+) Transcript_22345:2426-2728(+)